MHGEVTPPASGAQVFPFNRFRSSAEPFATSAHTCFRAHRDLAHAGQIVDANPLRVGLHRHRDCDHAYSNDFGRGQCHLAARAWRAGLETPLSSEYFTRSQDWGKLNCKIKAR